MNEKTKYGCFHTMLQIIYCFFICIGSCRVRQTMTERVFAGSVIVSPKKCLFFSRHSLA